MQFDKKKLESMLEGMHCSSFQVNHSSQTLFTYGDVTDYFNVASIRKPLLSILIGIEWEKGVLDLDATLEELGIDDNEPSLTSQEKQATVEDLLTFRSGVYHDANFETQKARDTRPPRGSHLPKTFYYYNNWDSNALGTIYTKLTHQDIFESFQKKIAEQIDMPDFNVTNCEYITDANSIHKAYKFRMSVRDLICFGQLMLDNGVYGVKQIISKKWIEKSLKTYTTDEDGKGVGYLWNIEHEGKLWGDLAYPRGSFGFSGYPGHFLLIVPSKQLVIVYSHTLENKVKPFVTSKEFGDLASIVITYFE